MIVHAAIPIAPIILLPFIVVVFVIVFPVWSLALVLLWGARGIAWLAGRAWTAAGRTPPAALGGPRRAYRWVITCGGLFDETRRAGG